MSIRPRKSTKVYGRRHQRQRRLVLARHPVCVICERAPATVADHIDGNPENNDMHNMQGLCVPCHGRKTAAHDGGFGNRIRRATN